MRHSKEYIAEATRFASIAVFIVCGTNDLADSAMRDAAYAISTSPFHEDRDVRHYAARALKASDRVQGQLKSLLLDNKSYGRFIDFADERDGQLKRDILILRLAVKSALDRMGDGDADVKAQVETAQCMLDIAVEVQQSYFRQLWVNTGVRLTRTFSLYSMEGARNLWRRVSDRVLVPTAEGVGTIDLGKDPQCAAACRALINRLADVTLLVKAAEGAAGTNNGNNFKL